MMVSALIQFGTFSLILAKVELGSIMYCHHTDYQPIFINIAQCYIFIIFLALPYHEKMFGLSASKFTIKNHLVGCWLYKYFVFLFIVFSLIV